MYQVIFLFLIVLHQWKKTSVFRSFKAPEQSAKFYIKDTGFSDW